MSGASPASILFSTDGYELAVVNGTSTPTGTRALLVAGSDGTVSRFLTVDTSGRVTIVGAGVAGTPAGGVASVQGVAGGTALTISGTVTANIGTSGSLALDATVAKLTITQGAALGSNTQALVGGSVTTAAPTYTTGNINPFSLTTAGALRVDGSGVTQPVSGTVTANAGTGNFTVAQATAANLNATIVGTTAAGSGAASGLVTIQGNASGTPVPVSGTVTATNASVSTTGSAPPASATYIGGSVTTAAPAYTTGQMSALSLTTSGLLRVDGSGVTQPVSGTITANIGTSGSLALDATLLSMLLTDNAAFIDGTTKVQSVGYIFDEVAGTALTENDVAAARIDSKRAQVNVIEDGTTRGTRATVKAASTAAVAADTALVVAISPNNSVSVVTDKSATGTVTSVAASVTTVSILASNANRILATIYNESNKTMYVKLGTTASLTSYTIPIFQNSYWELPVSYTGAIDAIWATGASGNARVTELT